MHMSTSPVYRVARHPAPSPTFTLFPHLPPELRLFIFSLAMPDSRVVVVEPETAKPPTPSPLPPLVGSSLCDELARPPPPPKGPRAAATEPSWRSSTQIPPLLHVNYEARCEALKHYQLSLGAGASAQPKIYLDFSRDTIFLGESATTPEALQLLRATPDLRRARVLAMGLESVWRVLRCLDPEDQALNKVVVAEPPPEGRALGRLPQLEEDDPEPRRLGTADHEAPLGWGVTMGATTTTTLTDDAADLTRDWDTPCLDLRDKVPKGSLECFMTKYQDHGDPERKRREEALEEFRSAMDLMTTAWAREPTVATARFRTRRPRRVLMG